MAAPSPWQQINHNKIWTAVAVVTLLLPCIYGLYMVREASLWASDSDTENRVHLVQDRIHEFHLQNGTYPPTLEVLNLPFSTDDLEYKLASDGYRMTAPTKRMRPMVYDQNGRVWSE